MQTLIDKNKELVKGKIQGILDAKKAKDADRQEDARNADRADKLKDKIGRGTKIGHKDMDWLKAQMALEKAKAALPGLQDQAKIAADNVAQRAKDQKTWGDMLLELQAINVREAELLKAK